MHRLIIAGAAVALATTAYAQSTAPAAGAAR